MCELNYVEVVFAYTKIIQYSGHGKVILEFLWNIFVITYTELFEEMCVCVFFVCLFLRKYKKEMFHHIFSPTYEKKESFTILFSQTQIKHVSVCEQKVIFGWESWVFYRNLQFFLRNLYCVYLWRLLAKDSKGTFSFKRQKWRNLSILGPFKVDITEIAAAGLYRTG